VGYSEADTPEKTTNLQKRLRPARPFDCHVRHYHAYVVIVVFLGVALHALATTSSLVC